MDRALGTEIFRVFTRIVDWGGGDLSIATPSAEYLFRKYSSIFLKISTSSDIGVHREKIQRVKHILN